MITYQDHYKRLQSFLCCIANAGNNISRKLRISIDCCCDINNFNILILYWNVLVNYNPENPQCLTQQEIDLIWDKVSNLCNICFSPYNSNDEDMELFRTTEDDDSRITEDGEFRILE